MYNLDVQSRATSAQGLIQFLDSQYICSGRLARLSTSGILYVIVIGIIRDALERDFISHMSLHRDRATWLYRDAVWGSIASQGSCSGVRWCLLP